MSARLSPGGALLRSSRMFSVPNPLPKPGGEACCDCTIWISDGDRAPSLHTNPSPRPKPRESSVTGAFKRSLPLRPTTKSSTPVVRIKQIDCFENVTDYSSAADHTLSLQKFQELNVPVTLPGNNRSRLGGLNVGAKSVFEDNGDFTYIGPGRENEEKRWKFKGPWLAGLTEGEFNRFLRKSVRNKRDAFRDFLRKRIAAELTAAKHQKALDAGERIPPQVHDHDVTEGLLTEYLRKLRSDRITLYSLVSEFLDLAPLNPPSSLGDYGNSTEKTKRPSLYAENGPPISHPSGGMSYLRTAAFAENHPVYGPQAHKTPVLARIIAPRSGPASAKLGVGGFITETPHGDTTFNQRSFFGRKPGITGIASFDPEIKGGAKAYVQPNSARMDSSGMMQITVSEPEEEAQLIYKEMTGTAKIYNHKIKSRGVKGQERRPLVRTVQSTLKTDQPEQPEQADKTVAGSSQTYGLDSRML